ncbi:MAG: hypothetical protein ACRD2J_17040 [Thermoanaerobaculia bacterium]
MKPLLALLAWFVAACASAPTEPVAQTPPWERNPALQTTDVPEVLIREWTRAENRESCAPLAFADLGVGAGATPRRANFSGGWAVAWDRPDLRSAFGIAGTGVAPGPDMYRDWENQRTWAGGAWAGWGLEGGTGPKYLAYIVVPGEECLYNVWSHVSVGHVERLIESLRRVNVP